MSSIYVETNPLTIAVCQNPNVTEKNPLIYRNGGHRIEVHKVTFLEIPTETQIDKLHSATPDVWDEDPTSEAAENQEFYLK